jgi:hypothetical protein
VLDVAADEDYEIPSDMVFDEDGEPDWDAYYASVIGSVETQTMPITITQRFRGTTAAVGAIGLGIQQVLEPQKVKKQIVVQRDDSGDPDNPEKELHLDFDPEDPRQTRAVVRPHIRQARLDEE